MKISLVAAMAHNRVIGKDNQMPWHLPADLKHFKSITLGRPVIMGRKTFESLGRPLPNRLNVVVSRQLAKAPPGCIVTTNLDNALESVGDETDVKVIGGQRLFEAALPIASNMFLTFIDAEFDGDTFFPAWDEAEWRVVSEKRCQPDQKNPYSYRFVEYSRLTSSESVRISC